VNFALTSSEEELVMVATITRDELKNKMDRGDRFKLVETLPEGAFEQIHLPGAINIPPDQLQRLAPKKLPDKNEEIVVYCASPT
jgi:rhodanese-related sulfurtransferase